MLQKKYLLILFGFLLIGIYIYFRFIYKRINDTLYFVYLKNDGLYIKLFFSLFILLMFLLSIYMIVRTIVEFLTSKAIKIPSNIIARIILKGLLLIKESLLAVNDFIGDKVPDSYEKLKKIITIWYNFCKKKELFFLITFVILPYIILGVFFLIDTFIFFKFYYFYKVLPLIVFPLLSSLLNFLIQELLKNLDYISEELIITHSFLPNGKDQFRFNVKPGVSTEDAQDMLKTFIPEYLTLYSIGSYYNFYKDKETSFKKSGLFFMYFCYFIGCSYILIANFIYIKSLFFS